MISQVSRRILSASLRCQHAQFISPTSASTIATRLFSSLPYHLVVGMPALSPTMETGIISEWKVKEGEAFAAGDSLAEIETDKASIDFEAQDDGVVAKILVDAGTADITVGKPIMVTVEEEEDVAAFSDFVVEEEETPSSPVEEKVSAPPEPTPAPEPITPVAAPVVEAVPAPIVDAPVPVVEAETIVAEAAPTVGTSWGNFAKIKSPLASILSADQQKYVDKYGSTGQVPL
ncbi:hypothetical protein CTEN210_07098 [Chaetoceros tenuissimus]|uniref:Lipoyl-binding domain-containing protein n=1 Tax=Chaetoceros tenuissimus TaxID=426638 RepID=A0AAD3CR28_9STRA|nr:hypothetical protein CTEN210_07098 [Chaetoceros tenuissimus]